MIDFDEPLYVIGVKPWDIILCLLVFIIGVLIVKIVSLIIKKSLMKAPVDELMADFVARVIRLILYIFVTFTALGFIGVEIGAYVVGISVVIGFVLGFALSETLGNIAGGFMIAITHPFKVGDFVTTAGETGVIKCVGISVTEMDTLDNKHVIIPNRSVWGSSVVNFTHNPTRRVDMEFDVDYKDDLDHVLKVTTELINSMCHVLKDPAPQVAVSSLSDSSVKIVVRPWTKTDHYWDVYLDFQKKLKEVYDKEGISIPYPQLDVTIRGEMPKP